MFNHIRYDIPKLERVTKPDGTRLYQTPSGLAYPSVTTVTGLFNKQSIMEWRKRVGEEEATKISTRASKRGTKIHSLCENHLNNESVVPEMLDRAMWDSMLPELSKINNIRCLETTLYSDYLKVAGTVDCIAEYNGRLSVIDFKTSAKIKERKWISNYFMQCAAYSVAFEERTGISVPDLVIIIGVDDEQCQVFVEKRDAWIDQFKELRAQYDKENPGTFFGSWAKYAVEQRLLYNPLK